MFIHNVNKEKIENHTTKNYKLELFNFLRHFTFFIMTLFNTLFKI